MQFQTMEEDREASITQHNEPIALGDSASAENVDKVLVDVQAERIGDWNNDPGYSAYTFGFLALTKTAIGSGVLGLPAALKTTGWLAGIFVLLFTWAGSLVGQSILFKCAFRCGGRDTSWFNLARKSFSWLPIVADFAIAFKCIGVSGSYLMYHSSYPLLLVIALHSIWTLLFAVLCDL
jgi:amino acid permease